MLTIGRVRTLAPLFALSVMCGCGSAQFPDTPIPLTPTATRSASGSANGSTNGRSRATAADLNRWAARFRTPNLCVFEARGTLSSQPALAWRQLQACSRRRDFDVLEPLLRHPWLPMIKGAKEAGIDVLARAIARRGEIATDAGSCQAAGIDLYALENESSLAPPPPGYVIAAGRVDAARPTVDMVQLAYQLPGYSDRYISSRRSPSWRRGNRRRRYRYNQKSRARDLQAWYPTKRRLRFKPNRRCPVVYGDLRVVLGRLTRSEEPTEPGGYEIGHVSVLNCYRFNAEVRNTEPEAGL